MKRALLAIAMLGVGASSILAADRLTDRDIKALVARIEDGRSIATVLRKPRSATTSTTSKKTSIAWKSG